METPRMWTSENDFLNGGHVEKAIIDMSAVLCRRGVLYSTLRR
jgi:hypothetical protein